MMRRSVVFIVFLLVFQSLGFGQAFRGSLAGSVVDASGAAVPGAAVKIVNKDTGLTRSIQTEAAGEFTFADLMPGIYSVTTDKTGFGPFTQEIEVAAGKIASLPIILGISKQTQTVEVQAAAATLETNDAVLNAVVDTRAVNDIPLNGRDFTQLLRLTPGYNDTGSTNGARVNQNNWQIDGADNNDFWHNANAINQGSISGVAGVLLPIDAIDQFNQQASGGADSGRNPGSSVNVVIKSGTNQVHGTAYYFNRNEALAAHNPFAPPGSPNPLLRNENYGFSLGGPIVKNRTFFFLTYEKQKFTAGNTAEATVPSSAWISQAETLMGRYGVAVNPVMVRVYNLLWPQSIASAAGTANNYFSNDPSKYKSDNGVIRLDHSFTDNEKISARAFLGTGEATAYSGSVYGEYFQSVPSRQPNYAVQLDSIVNARLVNQLLAGVNFFQQTFDDANHSQNLPATGFNTGVTNPGDFGSPNITIAGFTNGGVGETPNLGRTDTTGHLTDNLSYTRGAHQLKFGGEFRVSRLDVYYQRNVRGTFDFTGLAGPWDTNTPVAALADFLAGYLGPNQSDATISTGQPQRVYQERAISWWASDSWKVSQKLTFNYGVRYEYNQPLSEVTDRGISSFDPAFASGFAIVGTNVKSLYNSDKLAFAPRLGFAYTPIRDGKTVIRGGYGVYFDVLNGTYFIDGSSGDGERGVSRNPIGATPVFGVTAGTNPASVVKNGVYIFGATPTPPFGAFGISPSLTSPYTQNFNINVQRQLSKNTLLQVGYVGSQSRHLADKRDLNQPLPDPTGLLSEQQRRPYYSRFPNLSGITWLETAANSQYNSLQTSLRSTSFHGLTGQVSYTLSHARDDQSYARYAEPESSYCLSCDYGSSDFDIRSNASAYAIYDIPNFVKSHPHIGGGWQLNAIFVVHTGTPFSVTTGSNVSNSYGGGDRVNLVGPLFSNVPTITNGSGNYANGYQYFNPSAFALPAAGTFGDTSRNQFYGPGFNALDFSVFKSTHITERISAEFRVEIFNLFNRLNLSGPDTSIDDKGSTFGQISGTVQAYNSPGIGNGEPRNVQLALKLKW